MTEKEPIEVVLQRLRERSVKDLPSRRASSLAELLSQWRAKAVAMPTERLPPVPSPWDIRQTLVSHLRDAAIPERHCERVVSPQPLPWRFHDDSGPVRWLGALREARKRIGGGAIVCLAGRPGTGKTQLAAQLAAEVVANGIDRGRPVPVRYTTAKDLSLAIQATYRHPTMTEREVRGRFVGPRLLIIDEVSLRTGSQFDRDLLDTIIDARYRATRRDTILITNTRADQLGAELGERIIDRMNETGGALICEWASFRSEPSRRLGFNPREPPISAEERASHTARIREQINTPKTATTEGDRQNGHDEPATHTHAEGA